MIYTLDIISHGIPFRVVYEEHPHGRKPTVRFYDRRYDSTPDGQFTGGEYYVDTLFENQANTEAFGLALYGGVDDWKISGSAMQLVFDWLFHTEHELKCER